MRFLVIEDTHHIADTIAEHFRLQKHIVEIAPSLEDARAFISSGQFDLIILDINLPDGIGFDFLKWLRDTKRTDPVLVLTARVAIDDKIDALDLGADDYVVKPFQMAELDARVRAILRRAHLELDEVIEIGKMSFDRVAQKVMVHDEIVQLSKSEFRLLEIFALNIDRVFDKSDLINKVYHMDNEVNENALELIISRLRKKIVDSGIEIKALRGLGYQARISEEVSH